MARERIPVSPQLLTWARETAGYDEAGAAARLRMPVAQLAAWESGEDAPTIAQLRKLATRYHRSLSVMLLQEPPVERTAPRDFRHVSADRRPWSPAMHTEFRRAVAERDVMLQLRDVSPESVAEPAPLPRITASTPVEDAAQALRNHLGFEPNERPRGNPNGVLNAWVDSVEKQGIVVMQARDIERTEMRGFSISEWPYPVIAINSTEWPRPRTFTVLHELTHLAMNLGGVCDLHEPRRRTTTESAGDLEHFSNQVAAAMLLPAAQLEADSVVSGAIASKDWSLDELQESAEHFGASSEAFLLRLITLGHASWTTYWKRKPQLDAAYEAAMAAQREEMRVRAKRNPERAGGPDYYVLKAQEVGRGYAGAVIDAYHSDKISALDAANYLHVRYSQLPKIEAQVR